MRGPFLSIALLFLTVGTALAQAPAIVPVQGRLTDTDGVGITGDLPVTFTLYADDAGSLSLFTDTMTVTFDEGVFAVYLGDGAPLDLALFRDNAPLYLGVAVDSDPEMPLFELGSVPFAAYAQYCGEAGSVGSDAIAGAIASGDLATVTASGSYLDLTNRPETLSDFSSSCMDGYVMKYTAASGWTCAPDQDTDTDTQYTAGAGIRLVGTEFSIDPSATQARVTGTCPPGEFVSGVNQDGTVTCAADANDVYTDAMAVSATALARQAAVEEASCLDRTGTWNGTSCEEPILIVPNSQNIANPDAVTTCSSRGDGYTQLATAWELMAWYNALPSKPAIRWVWAIGGGQKYTQVPYNEVLNCASFGVNRFPLCRGGGGAAARAARLPGQHLQSRPARSNDQNRQTRV